MRAALMCVVLSAGCYEYIPVDSTPPAAGTPIAIDVSDVGRVALGGSMGPSIDRVEGRLVQRDNGSYLMKVSSVTLLRGGTEPWGGEEVTLKPDYVSRVYMQRLNKVKTGLGIGLVVGAVVGISAQQLFGGGTSDLPNEVPDSLKTNRIPRVRLPILSFKF